MSIESYSFIEHFDYMCKFVPQPFFISGDEFLDFFYNSEEEEYMLKTTKYTYSLSSGVLKKIVDALGVKVKLLNAVSDNEVDVIDMVIPIIKKLFKCYAECFVFYARQEDPLTIIELNVNAVKGEEGTRYENSPSPWETAIKEFPSNFTCFAEFIDRWCIDNKDYTLQVRASDLMPSGTQVSMTLFRPSNELVVPMLEFCSKFSNMEGFTEVHPTLYDTVSGVEIKYPMKYSYKDMNFREMYEKLMHVYETTDLNDFIFREINELAASDDAPLKIKNYIASLLTESELNLNQSVRAILDDAVNMTAQMKPNKKKKFLQQLGTLIGWCFCMKHSGCSSCGSIHL